MDKNEMLAYTDLDWLEILNNLAIDTRDFDLEKSSERKITNENSPVKSVTYLKKYDHQIKWF